MHEHKKSRKADLKVGGSTLTVSLTATRTNWPRKVRELILDSRGQGHLWDPIGPSGWFDEIADD